jgi:hypothetical protein
MCQDKAQALGEGLAAQAQNEVRFGATQQMQESLPLGVLGARHPPSPTADFVQFAQVSLGIAKAQHIHLMFRGCAGD